MGDLRGAFEAKALEFIEVLKIGRTQLQDAVPMTLGQEFLAFAIMIGEDELRLREARALITEVNLGATATATAIAIGTGTGINAPAGYADLAIPLRARASGVPVVKAVNLVEGTALTTGGTIAEVAEALGIMSRAGMNALLVPDRLTQPVRMNRCGDSRVARTLRLPPRQAPALPSVCGCLRIPCRPASATIRSCQFYNPLKDLA